MLTTDCTDNTDGAIDISAITSCEGDGAVTCFMCEKRGWGQAGGWYKWGEKTICGMCVKEKQCSREQ